LIKTANGTNEHLFLMNKRKRMEKKMAGTEASRIRSPFLRNSTRGKKLKNKSTNMLT
jgi:hypothetical protein